MVWYSANKFVSTVPSPNKTEYNFYNYPQCITSLTNY